MIIPKFRSSGFRISELGSFYKRSRTVFRVYAPDYARMELVLNNKKHDMIRRGSYFELDIWGDHELERYHYLGDGKIRFRDPFSYASDDNDSFVLNRHKFLNEKIEVKEKVIAPVIYECNIRDFSSSDAYPGRYHKKFLAFSESGLKKDDYFMLGLDYLKNLGITHLQLMPVFAYDYDKSSYNWGYNPVAYNYVHADYLEKPNDPYAFVNELRQTVNVLHRNGIRVVLDVVFNHVYDKIKNDLGKMLKGRLFRYRPDGTYAEGTWCGNEVKSEDPFVRSYIIEMVKRYLELFDIDGIRMDLMGISDIKTVNQIRESLRKKKADFLVYGEGWNMGDVLPVIERASIINYRRLPGVMMFNDYFRESVVRYVSGDNTVVDDMINVLRASESYLDHEHSLNYTECHDNYTMYDRMCTYKADEQPWMRENRCRLALALTMVARGTPFIHAGQEFLRTKQMVENSYNASDEINKLDWDLRVSNNYLCDYLKDLIEIRKLNPAFHKADTKVSFEDYYGCLIYRLDDLMIIINPTTDEYVYRSEKELQVILDAQGKCDYTQDNVTISPLSLVICR